MAAIAFKLADLGHELELFRLDRLDLYRLYTGTPNTHDWLVDGLSNLSTGHHFYYIWEHPFSATDYSCWDHSCGLDSQTPRRFK